MTIEGVDIEFIGEAHLRGLVDNQVPESRTLDFKRDAYGRSDGDKAEFLADVSALANTAGGHLVLGIAEKEGVAGELVGLDPSLDTDGYILWLDSVSRDGIQPRISGIRIKAIALASGSTAIVLQVPPSLHKPHCVAFQGRNKFWGRATRGKFPLDVGQLRELFAMSGSTIDRLKRYHLDRVARVEAGLHPIALEKGAGTLVVHIVPFSALTFDEKRLPAKELESKWDQFRPYRVMGLSCRVNFDGLLIYSTGANQAMGYVQLFRNGISEMCRPGFVTMRTERADMPEYGVVYSSNFEIGVTEIALYHMSALAELGYSPPFVVFVTLIGVADAQIDSNEWHDRRKLIGENTISLDEVTFEMVPQSAGETAKTLKPMFDQIANAGGRAESDHFDPEGNWQLRIPNRK